jgi:hypothetical protein
MDRDLFQVSFRSGSPNLSIGIAKLLPEKFHAAQHPGFRKFICAKMSNVLFCNGVPLMHNLFFACSKEAALVTLLNGFFIAWLSSSNK